VGQGLCLTGANYSTLLKWQLGVHLLPADCAGRPCPLCGWPVDVFGDHAVSCKKSGFEDRHLGTQTFFCQVLAGSLPGPCYYLPSVYFPPDFYKWLAAKWKEGGTTRKALERFPLDVPPARLGVCPLLLYSQKTTPNQLYPLSSWMILLPPVLS